MPSMLRAVIILPSEPKISPHTTNNGNAIKSPNILGSTNRSIGDNPIVRSASNSSFTFIVPSNAANDVLVRPAIMTDEISGENSRKIATPDKSTTYILAPYIFNCTPN